MGQTEQDRAHPPSWPPLSPAMTAAAPPVPAVPDADPPEVGAPDERDREPAPEVTAPVRAPRSRLRFAVIGAVTVLLIVVAVLLVTPAHRPGRSATIAPPGTGTVPVPTPGGTDPTASGAPGSPGGHPAATGSTVPTATPTTGATATPSGAPPTTPGEPAPPPSDPLTATYAVTVHDGPNEGYRVDVQLTNQGSAAVTGWQLVFTLPPGETVTKADGAVVVQAGPLVTLTPKNPAQALHPGQKVPVRFEVKGSTAPPDGCTVNGQPCG